MLPSVGLAVGLSVGEETGLGVGFETGFGVGSNARLVGANVTGARVGDTVFAVKGTSVGGCVLLVGDEVEIKTSPTGETVA